MHKKLDRQPFIDAYLIHKKPYLEKKVMAYLFTETHGLIATMTHWSTAKKNILSAFSLLACQLLVKPNISQLKKVEIKTFHPPLQGTHLFGGLYINELIYRFCETNQAHPELYQLYAQTIQALAQKKPLDQTVRLFEFRLQELLGYGLNFECLSESNYDWFYFEPERGLLPSLSSQKKHIHRNQLEKMYDQQFDDPLTQAASKKVFAILAKHLLGQNHLFIKKILPKSANTSRKNREENESNITA